MREVALPYATCGHTFRVTEIPKLPNSGETIEHQQPPSRVLSRRYATARRTSFRSIRNPPPTGILPAGMIGFAQSGHDYPSLEFPESGPVYKFSRRSL